MVTAIKVFVPEEASSIGDGIDDGGERHWKSNNVNSKNDDPTMERCHDEPPTNELCNSFERSNNESISGGGVASSVTNNLCSSNGYVSYADIEAMCGDETSRSPNNDYMPYSNMMAETATTADNYREAAVAKRSRLEKNEASEFQQHYYATSTRKYKKRTQLVVPTGTSLTNKQKIIQQLQQQSGDVGAHVPRKQKVALTAPKKQKVARSAPKKQKVPQPTKNNVSTMPIDPTFKRHVKQVQQKQLSALLKTPSNMTTKEDKYGEYGQRGITLRPSGKWQVQYYYNGKSQYIGVFESKTTAFAAYEMTREILGSNKETKSGPKLSDEEAASNFKAAKRAIFDALFSGK